MMHDLSIDEIAYHDQQKISAAEGTQRKSKSMRLFIKTIVFLRILNGIPKFASVGGKPVLHFVL